MIGTSLRCALRESLGAASASTAVTAEDPANTHFSDSAGSDTGACNVTNTVAAAVAPGTAAAGKQARVQLEEAYISAVMRARRVNGRRRCLKTVLLQLASPKKPKTIHIEWDQGGVEAAGSEVHFFCEGSWAQCRLTAEARRFATHRDALRALSGELHAIMPTSLAANGDPIDTEEDVHAQYKWLYCTRPTGNCRRPMMSVEEFEAKERRCGVRALRLEYLDSGFVHSQPRATGGAKRRRLSAAHGAKATTLTLAKLIGAGLVQAGNPVTIDEPGCSITATLNEHGGIVHGGVVHKSLSAFYGESVRRARRPLRPRARELACRLYSGRQPHRVL